jgi:hypothetical protein
MCGRMRTGSGLSFEDRVRTFGHDLREEIQPLPLDQGDDNNRYKSTKHFAQMYQLMLKTQLFLCKITPTEVLLRSMQASIGCIIL